EPAGVGNVLHHLHAGAQIELLRKGQLEDVSVDAPDRLGAIRRQEIDSDLLRYPVEPLQIGKVAGADVNNAFRRGADIPYDGIEILVVEQAGSALPVSLASNFQLGGAGDSF